MADERQMQQAHDTYDTLCQTLDEKGWKYDKIESELAIVSGVNGDDLPMGFQIKVDPDRMLVTLLSKLPFEVSEEKRTAFAAAVSIVNYKLVDGSFDYNVLTGLLLFRMTTSFRESIVGPEALLYMMYCSLSTIDEYNDKFADLQDSKISFDEFIDIVMK